RLERDRRARHVIEQGLELLVEERQPMLHARMAPGLADRFVECVVTHCGAELGDIAEAKAPNALGGELELAHRHKVELAQLCMAALRVGVEAADRFERVTEEVEANRKVHAGRIEIDDTSAYRIFARFA